MNNLNTEKVNLRKWRAQVNFFHKVKPVLLKKREYRNKFVAIKDKKVIDVDMDKFKLFRRINAKYPQEAFLIVKVEARPVIHEVPSVEISA